MGDNARIVYQREVLLATLEEKKLRLGLAWKKFSPRVVCITADGVLTHSKVPDNSTQSSSTKSVAERQFLLEKIDLSLLAADVEDAEDPSTDVGIVVKCQDLDHTESYFRVILSNQELEGFLSALREVAKEHNIDTVRCSELRVKTPTKSFFSKRSKQSVMRRAVSIAMDKHDRRSKKERILAKRGAFKWLPVKMSNDLIHGSWYVVESSQTISPHMSSSPDSIGNCYYSMYVFLGGLRSRRLAW